MTNNQSQIEDELVTIFANHYYPPGKSKIAGDYGYYMPDLLKALAHWHSQKILEEANWWNTIGYGDFVAAEKRIKELEKSNND